VNLDFLDGAVQKQLLRDDSWDIQPGEEVDAVQLEGQVKDTPFILLRACGFISMSEYLLWWMRVGFFP
jgi:hypothetical protein